MRVKLTTKPVLLQPEEVGWCRTVVLAESPHQISPENQPVWMIVVASEEKTFAEQGIVLLEAVEKTYQELELKSAEALYQNLASTEVDLTGVSIAACCMTLTTITLMTKNVAKVLLWRDKQFHTLMESQEDRWQAMEGRWQTGDVWWLEAGRVNVSIKVPDNASAEEIFITLSETATSLIGQESEKIGAGLAVKIGQKTEGEEDAFDKAKEDKTFKKKRRIMALGIGILLLLMLSIFWGAKTRQKQVWQQEYQQLASQVDQSIAVVEALYPTDQVRAREQLRSTLDLLDKKKEIFAGQKSWLTKWQAIYDKANQAYTTISGEVRLTEVPVWYPLNTIKPNFVGKQMRMCGNEVVVWDETTKTLVAINSTTKRNDIIAGGETFAEYKDFACDEKKIVALVGQKVLSVSLSRQNVATLVETDGELQQPALVGLFNNNVYVVDGGGQTIWRYPAITGGVGAKQNWFGPGVALSGNNFVKMEIDGQLWILEAKGRIWRYARGAPLSFSLNGLDVALGNKTQSMAVDVERDMIAILDGVNSRVVITTKNGVYRKQVMWSGLAEAEDIAFLPNQDTLFVLNKGNIYAINF